MTSNELKNIDYTLNQEQIKDKIAFGIRSGKLPAIILDDLSKRGIKLNVGEFYALIKEVYPDYQDYLIKFYNTFIPYVRKRLGNGKSPKQILRELKLFYPDKYDIEFLYRQVDRVKRSM